MKNKKISIILAVSLAFVIVLCGFGLHYYKTKKLIDEANTQIAEFSNSITAEQDRDKQFEMLCEFKEKTAEYEKSEKSITKISDMCNDEITKIKADFKDYYNSIISENTLSDIENITDKSALNSVLNNLDSLLSVLQSESSVTLTDEEYAEINSKTENLKTQYSKQILVIEEQEKAAKEAAERETAEKAAAEKSKAEAVREEQNSSKNSTTAQSNYSVNSNGNTNNSAPTKITDFSKYGHSWDVNPETGEKIPYSDEYVDSKGNVYNYKGEFMYNLSEWGVYYEKE